jgi:hypothetical protein
MIYENILVTAGLEALPATYTQVATGIAYPVLPAPNYQQEGGTTFTMDRLDCSWDPLSPCPPKHSYGSLFGSIIYIRAGDRYNYKVGGGTPDGQPILLWAYGASYMTVRDVVTVMAPGNSRFNKIHGYAFTRYPQNGPESYPHSRNLYPVVNNVATRVTSIRGSLGDIQDPDWSVSGVSAGSCLPGTPNCAVQSPWQNTSTNGARICYRTENGQVTNVPLWPWPMNDRIKAATAQAGAYSGPCSINCTWPGGVRPIRGVVDVTADMEALLGPIAAECRSDVVTPPPTSVEPIVEYLNR